MPRVSIEIGFALTFSPDIVGQSRERLIGLLGTMLGYTVRVNAKGAAGGYDANLVSVDRHGAWLKRLQTPRKGSEERLVWCAADFPGYDELESVHVY